MEAFRYLMLMGIALTLVGCNSSTPPAETSTSPSVPADSAVNTMPSSSAPATDVSPSQGSPMMLPGAASATGVTPAQDAPMILPGTTQAPANESGFPTAVAE